MNLKQIMATKAGWGMAALRVPTGIIFIAHGLPKFGFMGGRGLEATAGFLASLGLPLPMLMAWLVALAEVGGGALLIIGLLTRPAALTTAISMFVAIFWVHFENGLAGQGGYQWALLLFAASVALLVDGAGKASLDRAIAGNR